MTTKQAKFFDDNEDFYANVERQPDEAFFLGFLNTMGKAPASLLDIGGGAGIFATDIVDAFPEMSVTVVDPSEALLARIKDPRITKRPGSLPHDIRCDAGFDYIHVKEVLHHVTGRSVAGSKVLLGECLETIKRCLNDGGFIFIHELFYESYLVPRLSRDMIFYALLLQNRLRVRIPAREFLLHLKVCFYTRAEFKALLLASGLEIVGYREEFWVDSPKKKLLLLKNWGRMEFILKTKAGDSMSPGRG